MSEPTPPAAKANKTPAKKKKKKKKKMKTSGLIEYCALCRGPYSRRDSYEHMHSMAHHRELQKMLNKDAVHHCFLCARTCHNLFEFSEHISTPQHRDLLMASRSPKTKALSFVKTVPMDVFESILERNRELKAQKSIQQPKTNPRNMKKLVEHQTGGSCTVAPVKDNKGSGHQESPACYSGQLAARTWNQNLIPQKMTPLPQQEKKKDDSVHSQPTKATGETSPTPSVQPGQQNIRSFPKPPPGNKPSVAAPSATGTAALLKQIRRELGVRELCRAEREARGQRIISAAQLPQSSVVQEKEKEQHLEAAETSQQSPTVCKPAATAQTCELPVPANKTSGKVRIAHKPGKSTTTTMEDKLRLTVNRLSGSSGPVRKAAVISRVNKRPVPSGTRTRPTWMETYNQARSKQDRSVGCPRFGIQLTNHSANHGVSQRPPESEQPLSEGYQWETVPSNPQETGRTSSPPQQKDVIYFDFFAETQSQAWVKENQGAEHPVHNQPPQNHPSKETTSAGTRMDQQEPADRSGLQLTNRSWLPEPPPSEHLPLTTACIQVNLPRQDDGGIPKEALVDKKRKHGTDDDFCSVEPSGKRSKEKSSVVNKDQTVWGELLALSLREDELSHQLQAMDQSLIHARNVMVAANAEVQRLTWLKHQVTAEAKGLRANLIEFLQKMRSDR